MKTDTIIQTATFNASPKQVYETLMDTRKHSKFTGSKSSISRKVGGRFKVFNGDIYGENVELSPSKRIVQKWKTKTTECWPKNHYSRVSFSLHRKGKKTLLRMRHSDVPKGCTDDLRKGWKKHYWTPMKDMLNM